ncbi:MAG: L-threonylcarbamoyladenylate synthase [bacterium]
MRLIKLEEKNKKKVISQTLKVLKDGGLVVFPSDTVYGLLVDSTNEQAVKKLISFKERPAGKAISVFIPNIQMIEMICNINSSQKNIMEKILPGPFTVVLDYKKEKSKFQISKLLLSEKQTLGIRYPDFELIDILVSKFGKPVTATSANISGYSSVYSIQSFFKQLSKKRKDFLDLVIDGGKLPFRKPSTVIDLTSERIKQLRTGDVKLIETKKYISVSEKETKELAKKLLKENIKDINTRPLVFVLKGELGVGKTIFAKGLGEFLGINNIVSPSFVIYYEYDILTQNSKLKSQNFNFKSQKFIHGDLYNVVDGEELVNVDFERYLQKGNVMCIEWGEKSSRLIKKFTTQAKVLYIDMSYLGKEKRKLLISSIGKNK